jgi:hypothetical protein
LEKGGRKEISWVGWGDSRQGGPSALTVLLSSRETDLARTEVAARARMRNNFISLKNGRVDRSETESWWWWWSSEVNVLVGWRLRSLKYDHLHG